MNNAFNKATWIIRIVILTAALAGVFYTMSMLRQSQPPQDTVKVVIPPTDGEKPPTQ